MNGIDCDPVSVGWRCFVPDPGVPLHASARALAIRERMTIDSFSDETPLSSACKIDRASVY